jgi:sugar-phosphatase
VNELFMIAGPAGSGKTTLGVALASRLGAPHLDLDDVTGDLVGRFLAEHPERTEPEALLALRDLRYAQLAETARLLMSGESSSDLVLIAPFTVEISSVDRWGRWLADVGVPSASAHLVWLTLPPGERLRRMAARGASRDAAALATAGSGDDMPEPAPPGVPCLAVDALLAVGEQADIAMQRFGNGSVPK